LRSSSTVGDALPRSTPAMRADARIL
jgi:hypothetical protein